MGNRKVVESPSQVYTEVSYYPSGQQEYSAEYLNGKLDGMNRHWSVDGYLISESEYSHGKLHGIWKKYYENGNIEREVTRTADGLCVRQGIDGPFTPRCERTLEPVAILCLQKWEKLL